MLASGQATTVQQFPVNATTLDGSGCEWFGNRQGNPNRHYRLHKLKTIAVPADEPGGDRFAG
jgi:hypothetical protein